MQWHTINRFSLIIPVLLAISAISCEKVLVEADPSRTGMDYYPLSQGLYRTYDVFQINYNFASENDTLVYEIKERIADNYLNQEGDTTFIMERLKRVSVQSTWQLDSVYHIRRNNYQAIELNNNIPLLKLVFPVAEGKTWDSNLLNSSLADNFKMIDVGRPFSLYDTVFSNTLTVLQRNIQDEIVRKEINKEVYSLNIGPVYKIIQNINYCANPDCIGQGIITSGLLQELKLKAYGKE